LNGKKNGELLREAELSGYEVLLTVDQAILRQQKFRWSQALDHLDPVPYKSA
jgi:hypothetical protein